MTKMTLSWGGSAHHVFGFRFEQRLEGDVVVSVFSVEIENPTVDGKPA